MFSGYDMAMSCGFSGTEYQWLESLYGESKSKINSKEFSAQIIRCEYCDSEHIIDNTKGVKQCTQCGAVLKLRCEKEKQSSSEFNSAMVDWIKFHEESWPLSDTIETEEQTLQKKEKICSKGLFRNFRYKNSK